MIEAKLEPPTLESGTERIQPRDCSAQRFRRMGGWGRYEDEVGKRKQLLERAWGLRGPKRGKSSAQTCHSHAMGDAVDVGVCDSVADSFFCLGPDKNQSCRSAKGV